MIIDLILDRKGGSKYDAPEFYRSCACYGDVGTDITRAMDFGDESDVQKALCEYIDRNEYNPAIKEYVRSVRWLPTFDELYGGKRYV